jgi:hypothetical protein
VRCVHDVRLANRSRTLAVTQVFSFALVGAGIAFALAATADLYFGFRSGYGWIALGGAVLFTLAGLGFAGLIRRVGNRAKRMS